MKLTGNIRYRTTWRGKLILQVEVTWRIQDLATVRPLYKAEWNVEPRYTNFTKWRDATTEDLTAALAQGDDS